MFTTRHSCQRFVFPKLSFSPIKHSAGCSLLKVSSGLTNGNGDLYIWRKKNTFVKIPHGMKLSALIAGLKADSSLLLKLNKKAEMFGIPVYKIKRNHGYELAMDLL